MAGRLLQAAKVAIGLILVSGTLMVALWWMAARAGNADEPPVAPEEIRASFRRSVGWLQMHEAEVLGDGNVALWWMLKAAAEQSHDPYLDQLVKQSIARVYGGNNATSPWRRILEPSATIVPNDLITDGLESYQRFYYYAATCRNIDGDSGEGGVRAFLAGNTCSPNWRKVVFRDKVCSTHQLLGIRMARNSGCPLDASVAKLEAQLLDDIGFQMSVDPVVTDPYIQRVLTLAWVAGPQYVKPVWLRRIMEAQQADGGWSGDRYVPGAPSYLQPATIRQRLGGMVPGLPAVEPARSGFHATAQGVLLMALVMRGH